MQRLPVESSDVVSVGYDEAARLLEVEFRGGRLYRYRDVEPEIYQQFLRAESHGQYLFAHVNGRYRYEKVSGEAADTASEALAFVTGNVDKLLYLQRLSAMFGFEVEQVSLPVDEIQSDNPEEIAVKKAKQAYRLAKRPVLINDSFWSILALRGFPGAFMAYVGRWLRSSDFLRLMQDTSDRTVVLTEMTVFYDGRRVKVFSKEHMGKVLTAPKGSSTIAIEEIVVFAGQTKTIAELKAAGETGIDPKETAAHEFARWYSVQRRLKRL